MARLIEVQAGQALPARLTLQQGDILLFQASGGQVLVGAEVVECLGAFAPGLLGLNGAILSPMGAPDTVLFLARLSGQARIKVVTGDPWGSAETRMLELTVQP